jgi:hypothetical protein
MAITSEEEWAERAAAFLKHKLKEAEVTYVELAKRLKKHGYAVEGTNLGLPDQWSKGGAVLYLTQHFEGDLSIPNTTFDSVFVTMLIIEP